MTLKTAIRFQSEVEPGKIWQECQKRLGNPGSQKWSKVIEFSPSAAGSNARVRALEIYMNNLGQGLPGVLQLQAKYLSSYLAAVEVSIDTEYGYRAENGAGCEDFHAWFITNLAPVLTEVAKGDWEWQDESTQEWHVGFEGLAKLGDATKGDPDAIVLGVDSSTLAI